MYQKYTNLDDALYYLAEQVRDSIDYAQATCPRFNNPREMFQYLRGNTTYQNDPSGTELFQKMETLFSNYTSANGTYYCPGCGDCDCFVITALACMYAQGWDDMFIVLAGNGSEPSHIWCGLWWDGEPYHIDLTQPWPDTYRNYKYVQILEL